MFSRRTELPALPALRTPLHSELRYSVTLWRIATPLFSILWFFGTVAHPLTWLSGKEGFWISSIVK